MKFEEYMQTLEDSSDAVDSEVQQNIAKTMGERERVSRTVQADKEDIGESSIPMGRSQAMAQFCCCLDSLLPWLRLKDEEKNDTSRHLENSTV